MRQLLSHNGRSYSYRGCLTRFLYFPFAPLKKPH